MGKISKKREMLLRYSLGESLISTNANTQDNAVAWKILIELYKKQELVPKELLCYQGMLQAEWLRDGDSWSNEAIDCFFDIINCINECCMPDYIKKIKEGKMEFIYDIDLNVIGIREVDQLKTEENNMPRMSKEREALLRYRLADAYFNGHSVFEGDTWEELMELYKNEEMVPKEFLCYLYALNEELNKEGNIWPDEVKNVYYEIVNNVFEYCKPEFMRKIEEGEMEFIYDSHCDVIGIREIDFSKTEE